MIEKISIENFKCFQKTEVSGFKGINLLGGKNNAGKTCFLEAVYFAVNPHWYSDITGSRYGGFRDQEKNSCLFFNYNFDNHIKMSLNYYNETVSSFTSRYNNDLKILYGDGQAVRSNDNIQLIFSKSTQLPRLFHLSDEFDKADIKGESEVILEMLQLIDSNIEEIKTYSSKPNVLYLRKKGEKTFSPLHDFGDALQKIMRYIITIMSFEKGGKHNYLLIDEIENGLHYTAHYDFWKMLFKLSKEYNIQIFATSHSLEMIRAFNEVAMQEGYADYAMYFEMSRHFKTQNIIANPMDMDMLHYELVTQNPFRGE